MNTKTKGDIAVGQAISHFISSGYEVCLPVGDKRDYDFLIEKNGHVLKVQVKFAGLYKNGQCKVGLRITGGNQSFSYTKKYKDNSFDLLFIYTEKDDKYLIPWKNLKYRNELTIRMPNTAMIPIAFVCIQ